MPLAEPEVARYPDVGSCVSEKTCPISPAPREVPVYAVFAYRMLVVPEVLFGFVPNPEYLLIKSAELDGGRERRDAMSRLGSLVSFLALASLDWILRRASTIAYAWRQTFLTSEGNDSIGSSALFKYNGTNEACDVVVVFPAQAAKTVFAKDSILHCRSAKNSSERYLGCAKV